MGNYVPNTPDEQLEMLRECGFESFDEAYDALERLCTLRPYGWAYIDENGFEWDAFIDEDEEKW